MRKGYGSGVWIKGMDHAVPQGMDQGMDRGVWIVCGFGALIHTLYFDSYPHGFVLKIGYSPESHWGKASVFRHIKVKKSQDDDHWTLFTGHTLAPATRSVGNQSKDPRPTHTCIFDLGIEDPASWSLLFITFPSEHWFTQPASTCWLDRNIYISFFVGLVFLLGMTAWLLIPGRSNELSPPTWGAVPLIKRAHDHNMP